MVTVVLLVCCRYYMKGVGGGHDHNVAGKLSRRLSTQVVKIRCKIWLLRNLC